MIVIGPALALFALWLLGALALSLADARHGTGLERLVTDFVAGIVALATLGMTTIALGGRIAVAHIYLLLLILAITYLWRRRTTTRHETTSTLPEQRPAWWSTRTLDPAGPAEHTALSQATPPPDSETPTPLLPRLQSILYALSSRLTPRVLLTATCLILLLLAVSASQDRLVWDGWAFWTLKARILFHEGTLPLATLAPAGPYPYAHPEYPLAVPLLDWWLYRHADAPDPALASLAGVFWFATLPPLVWVALKEHIGARFAALATLGTTAFWPLAFYASGGYADIVVALAILGSVLELRRLHSGWAGSVPRIGKGQGQFHSGMSRGEWRDEARTVDKLDHSLTDCSATEIAPGATRSQPALPAAIRSPDPSIGAATRLALYLALAALAKNEGLALALIGAMVAIASGLWYGERRLRYFVVYSIPFLALAPWFIFTRTLGLVPQHLDGAAPALGDVLARIPIIVAALGKLLLSRAWVPLPFLVLAALYSALRRGGFVAGTGWGVAGAYAAVVCGVYLGTGLELEWLLRTTLDRMVGDLVPALVVLSLWEIWPTETTRAGSVYSSVTRPDNLAPAERS